MIEGLSHVTFVVRDLDRMTAFLSEIFDAEPVYESGDTTFSLSPEKFFLIGGVWVAIMEGEPRSGRTYDHVAFKVPDEQLDLFAARVRAHGVDVREGRSRVAREGRSIYFHDHDNHLFELHTGTLEQRLRCYGETTAPGSE